MPLPTTTLTGANIDGELEAYIASVQAIQAPPPTLRGVELLRLLKRGTVGAGPYPAVALFEAANRIMTDLVILHGVKWLLGNNIFPFQAYTVDYGHHNHGDHDILAQGSGMVLAGEAFNVAPSFFPIKKARAIKKLRESAIRADFRVVMCNHDSVASGYRPKPRPGEYFVFVDTDTGQSTMVPNTRLHPTAIAR